MRILYRVKMIWYNLVLRYRLNHKPYLDEVEDYEDSTEGV